MRRTWIALVIMAVYGASSQTRGDANSQSSTIPKDESPAIIKGQVGASNESQKWTDPLTLLTVALVFVGLAQVFVYWRQKHIMEKGLAATEKAADAAHKTASAAIGAALPKLALHSLDFGEMGAANLAAKVQCPKIKVSAKNYGQTPAFVQFRAIEIVCMNALPKTPTYNNTAYNVSGETIIEARQTFEITEQSRSVLSPEDIDAVLSKRKYLFVYGYIQYQDFLNDNHILGFCKEFYPKQVFGDGEFRTGTYSFIEANAPPSYTASY
jgi:hypothetical protein